MTDDCRSGQAADEVNAKDVDMWSEETEMLILDDNNLCSIVRMGEQEESKVWERRMGGERGR